MAMLGACAAAQTFEGTAIDSVTGLGIAGIRVEIVQGTTANSATTDLQGYFLFENLKDGAWSVRYQSTAYTSRLDHVQVAAGSPVKLEARLAPYSRICGRVVYGRGTPVRGATILLNGAGIRVVATDGAGKFDLKHVLPPGDYTLSVTAPADLKPPDGGPGGDGVLGWVRTFYPGTYLREMASKIHVEPGVDALDLELKLVTGRAHAIRGICFNPDGSPASGVKITLSGGDVIADTVESEPDGGFELPAAVDGDWMLVAQMGTLQATEWVAMAGRDREGVNLRLSPPFTVTGKVSMEVREGMPVPKMNQVDLRSHIPRSYIDAGHAGEDFRARMEADGRFSIGDIYPGLYTVGGTGTPPPYYLDSIRVGGAELNMPEVELSGPLSILLEYKTNGGAVRGNCTSGSIWLVPQDRARGRRSRQAECDANGRYDLQTVRPGEYYVFNLAEQPIPNSWLFGIFDQTLLNHSATVTVRAGETTSADLRPH